MIKILSQLQHENYMPGCVSPVVLSEITKTLTMKDQILQAGWLMFGKVIVLET